jgi:hypothetical protein
MTKLTCKVCNCEFEQISENYKRKYCSNKCYKESFLIRNPNRLEKLCKICNEIKNYKLFRELKYKGGWRDINGNGRYANCKICESNLFKERYIKDSVPQLLSNSKIRAKEMNVPFNLTTEYLREILPKDMICPIFKVKMTRSKTSGRKGYRRDKHAPSIDRIFSEKGYVKGNVIIVSDIANRIKTDSTMKELEMTYLFYKDLIQKKF